MVSASAVQLDTLGTTLVSTLKTNAGISLSDDRSKEWRLGNAAKGNLKSTISLARSGFWLSYMFSHSSRSFSLFSFSYPSFPSFILLFTSAFAFMGKLFEWTHAAPRFRRTNVGEEVPFILGPCRKSRESEDEERARRCVTGKCHATVIYLWTPKGWWMRRCADGVGR